MTTAEVVRHFDAKRAGKSKWLAKCPAHPDRRPSLSITENNRGVGLYCQSNHCTFAEIVRAAGLKPEMLFSDYGEKADAKALEAQRRKRKAEEATAYRKRVREWIGFFRENGYITSEYEQDVTAASAAAMMLCDADKPHLHQILATAMERITAASFINLPQKERSHDYLHSRTEAAIRLPHL